MFKEAIIVVFAFIILYVILRLLLKKKPQAFRITAIALLVGSIVLNSYYNLKTFFPDFVLDGHVPLGDCSENLFVYKEDSQYPCQIIFAVLQGRDVRVDDSCHYFDFFLDTFSDGATSVSIGEAARENVLAAAASFPSVSRFHLLEMMNYAFKEEAPALEGLGFDELPFLYVQTEALTGDDTLIAIVDEYYNLYLMSETYFSTLTGTEIADKEESENEA